MAAPTYATDLTDITTAESTTSWTALGGGASGLSVEPDFTIQGSNCIAKQIKSETKGHHFNDGTVTIATDDHIYVWIYVSTPGTTDTLANGGLRVTIGTSGTARKEFYVAGNDTYAKGGWVCYPIEYSQTADNAVGSAGATPSYFGSVMKGTVTVKSPNLGVDAIRYGQNVSMVDGEAADEATFVGAAQYADNTTRSWGLIQEIAGGALVQGKILIGTSGTSCVFEEANILVVFPDNNPAAVNQHTGTGFKEIIIDNASTTVVWNSITFLSLDVTDKGVFTITDASSCEWNTCTFQNIDTSDLDASLTATGCTWRNTEQVTQNGATLTDCTFTDSPVLVNTAVLVVDDLSEVTGCDFVQGTTGHAVDLGTVTTSPTWTWDNTDSGYAATDGSTGQETIRVSVDSGQTLTINVAAGASTPTVYNTGLGTVDVVSGQVDLTVTVTDTSGTVIEDAMVYVVAGATGPMTEGDPIIDKDLTNASGVASDTRSYASDQSITGRVRKSTGSPLYKTASVVGTIDSGSGLAITIQLLDDE